MFANEHAADQLSDKRPENPRRFGPSDRSPPCSTGYGLSSIKHPVAFTRPTVLEFDPHGLGHLGHG